MSKQVLERSYKPVKSLCELRIKLINADRKKPHSYQKAFEFSGKIEAYEDVIQFIDKLIGDAT